MAGSVIIAEELRIGMWATHCCHRDLYQIKTNEEIEYIIESWEDVPEVEVWPTKRDALLCIRGRFKDSSDEIAMIDDMLKEES